MSDLGLFSLDTASDVNMGISLSQQSIRTNITRSPYKFAEVINKNPQARHSMDKDFSMLHNKCKELETLFGEFTNTSITIP